MVAHACNGASLGKQRQEDNTFKAGLNSIARLVSNKKAKQEVNRNRTEVKRKKRKRDINRFLKRRLV